MGAFQGGTVTQSVCTLYDRMYTFTNIYRRRFHTPNLLGLDPVGRLRRVRGTARRVRFSSYLTEEHYRRLSALAHRTGKSIARLLEEALTLLFRQEREPKGP